MKVYLDNCCFNRPYDDQVQMAVKLESEAKMEVQGAILRNKIDLTWSYVLDNENSKNPFPEILAVANSLSTLGIKPLDCLHLACAATAKCDAFLTTDKGILKKRENIQTIQILNPVEFIVTWSGKLED